MALEHDQSEIDSVAIYLARITELERSVTQFSIRNMKLQNQLNERDAEIARLRMLVRK